VGNGVEPQEPVGSAYLWLGRLYSTQNVLSEGIKRAAFFEAEMSEAEMKAIGLEDLQAASTKAVPFGSAFAKASLRVDLSVRRFGRMLSEGLSDRTEIRRNAKQILQELPVFGSGPGTFRSIYQLYRAQPRQAWAAYLHDDWLETLVTFGTVGAAFLGLVLMIALTHPLTGGGIRTGWVLVAMLWLAMGGALFHARFDLPFQIPSLLLLFLIESTILVCVSLRHASED
jgi:hypothetical protein